MTSYHTVPDHIFNILNIDEWFSLDYLFTSARSQQLFPESRCSARASSEHPCISEGSCRLPICPDFMAFISNLYFTSLKAFGEWCASWQEQIAAERRSVLSLLSFLFSENFSLTSVTPTRLRQTSYSKSSLKSSWQSLGTYCVPGTVPDFT